jgi:hypothetical protein
LSRDLALMDCAFAEGGGAELAPFEPGWPPQAANVSASAATSGAANRERAFTLPPDAFVHGESNRVMSRHKP